MPIYRIVHIISDMVHSFPPECLEAEKTKIHSRDGLEQVRHDGKLVSHGCNEFFGGMDYEPAN